MAKYGVERGQRADGMPFVYFPSKARTGKKVHIAMNGYSVMECGWWQRGQSYEVKSAITCEKCLERAPKLAEAIAEKVNAGFAKGE